MIPKYKNLQKKFSSIDFALLTDVLNELKTNSIILQTGEVFVPHTVQNSNVVAIKDVRITVSIVECAKSMERNANCASTKDVQTQFKIEDYVSSTGQKSRFVALMGVQIKRSLEECVGGTQEGVMMLMNNSVMPSF